MKFEFKNLECGEQSDSLFEIPDGYQVLNMGGMPGMSGMGAGGGSGGFPFPRPN
ncbi:MAG: hypothetical protein JRH01_26765 [Deltaproteobacteria bacterium]|nr:hypothetical protein [Deltaproteobacteria bacterium]